MKRYFATVLFTACASTTPGAHPHDMSAAQHDREAQREADAAVQDAVQYDPNARVVIQGCGPQDDVCWRSKRNPTAKFRDMAAQHKRAADAHRAASTALRETEANACVGIGPEDRDISPFERTDDISTIESLIERTAVGSGQAPRTNTVGVRIVFDTVPGLTQGKLQREVDCHLARAAVLGHNLPEMPDCPLVPRGAAARVLATEHGLAVEIRADDPTAVADIVARAERLKSR